MTDQAPAYATPDDGLAAIIAHGNRSYRSYRSAEPYQRGPNWFKTGDGSKISVIAGWGTYCRPRPDWPTEWGGVAADYAGPYRAVEAWLPGHDDPEEIDVDDLRAWIAEHGGLVAGPTDSESDLS
jgi:hypothetical protein